MYLINAKNYEKESFLMPLGHQLEDDTREVYYDISKWIDDFGPGRIEWVYKRPNEEMPYIVSQSRQEDGIAIWRLSETDTSVPGEGRCELRFFPTQSHSDVPDLIKTMVFRTYVFPSLTITGTPPAPYEDLIETIREMRNDTEEFKDVAESAKDTAVGASEAVQNMSASAHSVATGQAPTVSKTVDPETGEVNLDFGIPSGTAGEGAVVYNAEMTLTEAEKSRARSNIGIGFFSVVNGALNITYEED